MKSLSVGWAMCYLPILVIPLQGSVRGISQFSCETPTAPCSWADDKAGFWAVQCYSFRGRCTEPDVWLTRPGPWYGSLFSRLKIPTFGSSGALLVENFQENPRVTQIQQSHSAKRVCVYSAGRLPLTPFSFLLSPKGTSGGLLPLWWKDNKNMMSKVSGPLYFLWLLI